MEYRFTEDDVGGYVWMGSTGHRGNCYLGLTYSGMIFVEQVGFADFMLLWVSLQGEETPEAMTAGSGVE